MTGKAVDMFSDGARAYAQFRPHYPGALFAWLADIAPERRHAWDCGTGSGQAARGLARHFERVSATDRSLAQLRHACRHPRIGYWVAAAQQSGLAGGSVDLICVAQALHWFEPKSFFAEARRVARRGAAIAAWTYNLLQVTPAIDELIGHLYHHVLAGCWPPQRRLVESAYRELDLPFERIDVPAFEMSARWSLAQFRAYLGTWTAVTRYRATHGVDAVAELGAALEAAWGTAARRTVRWPLGILAGRIP